MRTAPITLSLIFLAGAACAGERPRGVVELFTSQGCSSCPPADRILADLARDPSLIVLSLPVDYWDYIGWKDTLASPACTARQKDYAAARGDGQVYTPQAVVDGLVHVVGSDRDAVLATVDAHKKALGVDVSAKVENSGVSVDVGAGAGRRASVWLFEIEPQATVAVGRGENAGHTLTYTNIVRKMTRLGDWTGKPAHYAARTEARPGDRYVALVQTGAEQTPGEIVGAAQTN
ncbi:MAG: DUF1223 domain-containing protein [Hyphomicrobiales bacterium]|nr:DUF1223 domain-containing protein [Hyphomicrobiales bacterium]